MACLADVSTSCVFQEVTTCSTSGGGSVNSVSAGTGISVTGTATDPIINNTGVLSVSAGAGISVSGTTTPSVALDLTYGAAWTAAQSWTVTDAATNTTTDLATFRHLTSGTAAASYGVGVLFSGEDAAGNTEDMGRLSFTWTNAANGTETSRLNVQLRNAGAALADIISVTATAVLFSTDNTVDLGASGATRPKTIYLSSGVNIASGFSHTISTGGGYVQYQILNAGSVHYHLFNSSSSASSGARPYVKITPSSNTGQTASTEINGFSWDAFTRTWAAGAITNQREFVVNAPTYAFASASTISNAATLYVSGSPNAGTNATITNAWSAWFGSKIRIDAGVALGGGAAPTFGTIGGSGPTAAAQNEWIEIWTNNGKRFVPAWA